MFISNATSIVFAAAATIVFFSADAGAAPLPEKEVTALIELEAVPLADAIRQLARQAHLNILLDPRLSEPPFSRMTVSVRWQGVTAREALAALLENYGLVLVESARPFPSR